MNESNIAAGSLALFFFFNPLLFKICFLLNRQRPPWFLHINYIPYRNATAIATDNILSTWDFEPQFFLSVRLCLTIEPLERKPIYGDWSSRN